MPEAPYEKARPHPSKATAQVVRCGSDVDYAELQLTTCFTFLRGGSHPEEYVAHAAELGYRALAITDTNTLAGVVRAHSAATQIGIPLIVGCRLVFEPPAAPPGFGVLVYPTDVASYGRLCRLLTLGKRRADKGDCLLTPHDLIDHAAGLLAVAVTPEVIDDRCIEMLRGLRRVFDDDRFSLSASCGYGHDDRDRLRRLADLADHVGAPLVATSDAHCHTAARQPLQDVLTCIRLGCTLEEAGTGLLPNAERRLKPPEEWARLFADYPGAIARTVQIAQYAAGFSLDQLRYQYPSEVIPAGLTAMQHLAELTRTGAADRYPAGVPAGVAAQIDHELRLIDELQFAHYFLTVEDMVRFARSRGILCQGRGAAANSAVCYCLGVTSVDPARIDVLFERFVSRERNEPPDIDIDFEHERREEVIQYLYRKYGRDRAALTAEVITYRGRSAVREVGKALGLSLDTVDRLARTLSWWGGAAPHRDEVQKLGLDPDDRTIRHLLRLSGEIQGFPRHLSQHVGGFVITQRPLCELVPIENAAMEDRTVIEWDKDDIDALGMLKVDVLGLGMLTCLRKTMTLVSESRPGEPALQLHTIPAEDPATYEMVQRADTVGVFQIESRAQMSMLPRLKPACFYDLVIEVAIVRPGPIQGDMVHPYLRRRSGEEPIEYADETMRRVLGKTLGVPLFQEQAMQLAIHAAGFTPDEADKLRRAVTGFRRYGDIETFRDQFVGGMLDRGYDRLFAERCFRQIEGFSTYGFPESHAASFALLVYASAYLKRHHPAAFACGLLNSQPMGFYAPAQIVRDAQQHGVEVRPIDANCSAWDCTLESPADGSDDAVDPASRPVLRLGMRLIKGLRQRDADRIRDAAVTHGPFDSVEAMWRASEVPARAIRRLARADAFGSLGLDRQAALWQAQKLRDVHAPLFATAPAADDGDAPLPAIPALRKVLQDYASTGLSLKSHPIAFLRRWLDSRGVVQAVTLQDAAVTPHGRSLAVAGVCLVRQRPGTASGITFMTLEDETGVANLIVRPAVFERCRAAARDGNVLLAFGRVERQGMVVHVKAHRITSLDAHLRELTSQSRNFR
jgi:error-prone DNA polymerase